jgi:cytochrome c biogenesis protein CcmG, thiol:disulfide interchange protein DsbE
VRRLIAGFLVLGALSSACGGGAKPGVNSSKIVEGSPSKLKTTLASMRGKPVVVNYWATWCGPCKSEMPRIVAAATEYAGKVSFLGVDVQDDTASAADFIRRYKMPFRSLSDPDGKIREAETIRGLPVTQFYSATGELSFEHNGEISDADLQDRIDEVLRAGRVARDAG